MSREKIETLYLHNTYKPQTLHIGDLGWGAPIYQVTLPFNHVLN